MAITGNNDILSMEAANIFCGNNGDSNHLRLSSVHLPSIEEMYVDHRAGGAPVAIEVDVCLSRLQCDFRLTGWTPNVDRLISAWSSGSNIFRFYGAVRSRTTGKVYQAYASMFGRLGKAQPAMWQRGALNASDYSIRGIINYQLTIAGTQVFRWDFFENTMTTAS